MHIGSSIHKIDRKSIITRVHTCQYDSVTLFPSWGARDCENPAPTNGKTGLEPGRLDSERPICSMLDSNMGKKREDPAEDVHKVDLYKRQL